jgi:hypothetical protein
LRVVSEEAPGRGGHGLSVLASERSHPGICPILLKIGRTTRRANGRKPVEFQPLRVPPSRDNGLLLFFFASNHLSNPYRVFSRFPTPVLHLESPKVANRLLLTVGVSPSKPEKIGTKLRPQKVNYLENYVDFDGGQALAAPSRGLSEVNAKGPQIGDNLR